MDRHSTGDKLFDTFWKAYPRRDAKGSAFKAWMKLDNPAETLEQILAALKWQCRSVDWTKDGGQYIPMPSTYLNQWRWMDEPREPARREQYVYRGDSETTSHPAPTYKPYAPVVNTEDDLIDISAMLKDAVDKIKGA